MNATLKPKLPDNSDEKDMLVAWTEFLKNPESEQVRALEMNVKEIREAKDELIKISNDDEQRMLYEITALLIEDPFKINEFKPIDNSFRSTLEVY